MPTVRGMMNWASNWTSLLPAILCLSSHTTNCFRCIIPFHPSDLVHPAEPILRPSPRGCEEDHRVGARRELMICWLRQGIRGATANGHQGYSGHPGLRLAARWLSRDAHSLRWRVCCPPPFRLLSFVLSPFHVWDERTKERDSQLQSSKSAISPKEGGLRVSG
jgi:hypothetical protein